MDMNQQCICSCICNWFFFVFMNIWDMTVFFGFNVKLQIRNSCMRWTENTCENCESSANSTHHNCLSGCKRIYFLVNLSRNQFVEKMCRGWEFPREIIEKSWKHNLWEISDDNFPRTPREFPHKHENLVHKNTTPPRPLKTSLPKNWTFYLY